MAEKVTKIEIPNSLQRSALISPPTEKINPSNAEATFVQSAMTLRFLKNN